MSFFSTDFDKPVDEDWVLPSCDSIFEDDGVFGLELLPPPSQSKMPWEEEDMRELPQPPETRKAPSPKRQRDAEDRSMTQNLLPSVPFPPVSPPKKPVLQRLTLSAPIVKEEPISKKAAQTYKQREIKQQFGALVPLLNTRPCLRDTENALYASLPQLALVHMLEIAREHEQICIPDASAFVSCATNPKTRVDWSRCQKTWGFHVLSLDKANENVIGCYFHTTSKRCYVASVDNDPLFTPHVIVEYVRKVSHDPALDVMVQQLPLANQTKSCKYFPSFHLPKATKRKLWQCIVLYMMLAAPNAPAIACANILQATEQNVMVLLYFFVQGLLYHAMERETEVLKSLKEHFPSKNKKHEALFASLDKQRNTKPNLPSKRISAARLGPFKGRQTDRVFCVVVNRKLGMYVPWEQMHTYNVFQLLARASLTPRDSEINYSDLAEKLPMVFPQKIHQRLHGRFQVRTDYMCTKDPVLCFAPLSHLLWPNATDEVQMFQCNQKRWKLEVQVETCTDTGAMERFLNATELTAEHLQQDDSCLSKWVSVVDESECALGIYYHDPCASLQRAAKHMDRIEGMHITMYQRLVMLCTKPGEIKRVMFVRDPFHGIWHGSRTQGIALRRHFSRGRTRIQTFTDMHHLQSHAKDCAHHLFASVEAWQESNLPHLDPYTSIPVWNYQHLQEHASAMGRGSLVRIDDLGPPRFFVAGNLPRINNLFDCKQCRVSENGDDWVRDLCTQHHHAPLSAWPDTACALLYGNQHVSLQPRTDANVQQQAMQIALAAPHSSYVLAAVHDPLIHYVPSYAELEHLAYERCLHYATQLGVNNVRLHTAALVDAIVPKNCTCCETKSVCLRALAALVRALSMKKEIRSISTNCTELQGRVLRTDILHLPFGLRCVHDWTRGLRCVLDMPFSQDNSPDLFVCHERDAVFMGQTHYTTTMLRLM